VIVAAGLALAGAGVALYFMSRMPEPAPSAARPAPPKPSAVAPEPWRDALPSAPEPARPRAARPAAPSPAAPSPTAEAAPTTATLLIESDVPDTSVFLDRVFLGTAPVTARDVAPGQHRVNLSATGYEGYAETIDIVAGPQTLSVKFKEIRLDATLAVTHKHALGSCTGTLHATPKGLTYDTSNKGDAFTAALTDLETFTMDYLQKNLRVKVKGGKTWNFTDPEGNVNRLYLFHQEVEKIRQRLIAGR
jgi:hypothetical protein